MAAVLLRRSSSVDSGKGNLSIENSLADISLCNELPAELARSFDDFDSLEGGHAREFIPEECLTPPLLEDGDWMQCVVTREDKLKFRFYVQIGENEGRFVMSAVQYGKDFFISQYESFPNDFDPTDLDMDAPDQKFCAELKRVDSKDICEYELFAVREDTPMVRVRHASAHYDEPGTDIRTLEVAMREEAVDAGTPASPKFNWDITHPLSSPKGSGRHRSVSSGNGGGLRCEEGELLMKNQLPSWNPESECLVMKFWNNRIRASSSKNYVLFKSSDLEDDERDPDLSDAVLQFGKVETGHYVLDFRAPMVPLNAFAIALSGFAYKV